MTAEIRAWISSQHLDGEGLTAGQLKDYLEHVPDHAALVDGDDKPLTTVEALWAVTER